LTWHSLGHFSLADGTPFEGFWDVQLTSVAVNSDELLTTAGVALVDSGSSYLVVPLADAGTIANKFDATCVNLNDDNTNIVVVECTNADGFKFALVDCATRQTSPNLDIFIEGINYPLSADDLFVEAEGSIPNTNKQCFLAMINAGTTSNMYVLGDTFMRKYYTAFDHKLKKVGFARKSKNGERQSPICALDKYLVEDLNRGSVFLTVLLSLLSIGVLGSGAIGARKYFLKRRGCGCGHGETARNSPTAGVAFSRLGESLGDNV